MLTTKPMTTLAASLFLGLVLAGCAAPGGDPFLTELRAAHTDQPFRGGQETPDHQWSFIDGSQNRISFLHWMPVTRDGSSTGGDAAKADRLFALGDGFKGRWCLGGAGITQAQIDAGYVHFHKESNPNWDAGHGGSSATQVGFWLRHVAVADGVEMMPGVVSRAGQVYPLMPTTSGLPGC